MNRRRPYWMRWSMRQLLSRCTQFSESRLFIFNPFPGYKYKDDIILFACIAFCPAFEYKQQQIPGIECSICTRERIFGHLSAA